MRVEGLNIQKWCSHVPSGNENLAVRCVWPVTNYCCRSLKCHSAIKCGSSGREGKVHEAATCLHFPSHCPISGKLSLPLVSAGAINILLPLLHFPESLLSGLFSLQHLLQCSARHILPRSSPNRLHLVLRLQQLRNSLSSSAFCPWASIPTQQPSGLLHLYSFPAKLYPSE